MSCFVCLNLHEEAVALRCGHMICQGCMERAVSNQENEESICPECRKLSEDAEVFCTYCMHTPVPAVKTCPTCEASFCDKHLNGHSSAEHVLIVPTTSFRSRKCSVHNEVLNYYCSDDGSIVCDTCWVIGEHKRHQVETLDEASEKKKEKLRNVLKKRQLRKAKTQERIETLRKQIRRVQDKANSLTVRTTALFTEIREQLATLERRMLKEVSRQEEQALLAIAERIQELEIRKDALSRQMSYTEKLCNMADPLVVLRAEKFDNSNTSLASEVSNGRRMSDEGVHDIHDLDDVLISMTLHRNLAKILKNTEQMIGFHMPQADDTLLDMDTAGDYVVISGDKKSVCKSIINQCRPETPERFYCVQVLSSRSFYSGRHAWEVEVSDCGDWMVGVAYPSIERKGPLSFIGINDKSWCIQKFNNEYSVKHCSIVNPINLDSSCCRFLVFLDYLAGQLSFYQLSDPISHLYTYRTFFIEPLHIALMVEDDAWVRIRS